MKPNQKKARSVSKNAPRKKITLSKVLEAKVELLAEKRDLTFSELVARVLEEELRRLGIDPYGEAGLDETSRGSRQK